MNAIFGDVATTVRSVGSGLGLYSADAALPNPDLLKWGFSALATADRRRTGLAHDCILNRTEGVHARLIRAHRVCPRSIATRRARHRERITALSARSQCGIDHAGARRSGHVGSRASARKMAQDGRKADRRIVGVVRNLRRVDGTKRRHSGRFIGRDTRAQ